MNVALHPPRMTREQFLDWVEQQDPPYEFDGERPVPMTGGSRRHDRIAFRLHAALDARLRGGTCEVLGPNAGVATVGTAVRYPDALVAASPGTDEDRLIPDVIAVFEVVSPTTERLDRVVKAHEYAAVPSIRCYVIVAQQEMRLTVLRRSDAGQDWTRTELAAGDVLELPELGVAIPVVELYERRPTASAGAA